MAYCLGAFPAGIAGCFWAYANQFIEPGSFGLQLAIGLVAASFLGGRRSIYGPIVGAALLELGALRTTSFQQFSLVAYGGFLIIAAIALRTGLSGIGQSVLRRVARLIAPDGDASLPRDVVIPDAAEPLTQVKGETLRVLGISKAFGGVQALDDVTLTCSPGNVTAVIGANGSGKTTLLNVISGFVRADGGSVVLGERTLDGMNAHQTASIAGVARTFQTPSVPHDMRVWEVAASGRYMRSGAGLVPSILRLRRYRSSMREDRKAALAQLTAVGLRAFAEEPAATQPLGRRRFIELARSMAGEPALILLDEPASGLTPNEVEHLGHLIKRLASRGATVVVVEHNFRWVLEVADAIHVLDHGKVIASGTASDISESKAVAESYLGQTTDVAVSDDVASATGALSEEVEALRLNGVHPPVLSSQHGLLGDSVLNAEDTTENAQDKRESVLRVNSLVSGYGDLRVLNEVDLAVAAGTVEIILGRNGAGKTTLLLALAGLLPTWKGTVWLDGREVSHDPAYRRVGEGVALVLEGKRIFRERTVHQNLLIGMQGGRRLSRRAREERITQTLERLPQMRPLMNRTAGGLSGGQQQLVAIAQALTANPKVLLLDEPSAGLSPALVDEVLDTVLAVRDSGVAVILVEQIVDRVLRVVDHVSVMDGGRVVLSGAPSLMSDPDLLRDAYFGQLGKA
jgi:ABC-type branched-subunit amino acid transport system ATPase component